MVSDFFSRKLHWRSKIITQCIHLTKSNNNYYSSYFNYITEKCKLHPCLDTKFEGQWANNLEILI